MKVSRVWLQRFFDAPLPEVSVLSDAFTFHAFEVESVEGEILDLKVLPDRAGYAMSHRGVAKELSAILNLPLKDDPLNQPLPNWNATEKLHISADKDYVIRHTGALYRGVKVGPSPVWLKELLESVGQRSINNVVDASNFVMLNIGQPTHAFDAGKISKSGEVLQVDIREAKKGERVLLLSGDEKELKEKVYIFADGTNGTPLDIAGIKGGMDSGVTDATTDLFISVGNYDGTLLRKSAQSMQVFTDASQRFQNRPSPELTAYGMRDLLAMISEVAGGELVGIIDIYPKPVQQTDVSVSVREVREVLGAGFGKVEIKDAFSRLGFSYAEDGDTFTVTPPFERSDLLIPEDLAEEVGRIIGYDKIEPTPLPPATNTIEINKNFYWADKIRTYLVSQGFSEVLTSVFTDEKGDRAAANKVDSDKPFLRKSLTPGLSVSLKMNALNRPLLGVSEVKIFEIGKIFKKGDEAWHLALGVTPGKKLAKKELESIFSVFGSPVGGTEVGDTIEIDFSEWVSKLSEPSAYEALPESKVTRYKPFFRFPFIDRDIAVWTPEGTTEKDVEGIILEKAGDLLVKHYLFDTFSKDGKTSYAFRLVFQSDERTLTDEEINPIMVAVTDIMNAKDGWQVR